MNIEHPTLTTEYINERFLWCLFLGALAGFWLDYALVTRGTTQPFDDRVTRWTHARTSPWLDRVFNVITNTGGVGRTVPVVLVAAFFIATKRRLEAGTLVGAAVVGQSLTYAVKALVSRDRPNLFYVPNMPTDTSFPSGHALGSTILYGLFAVWLWQAGHRGPATFLCVWIALVSFSRVYVGVHHPTDVIASVCLGLAFLAATLLIYGRMKTGQLS